METQVLPPETNSVSGEETTHGRSVGDKGWHGIAHGSLPGKENKELSVRNCALVPEF